MADKQRMMFWRKQLTARRRRENLRASGSIVNEHAPAGCDLPRGRVVSFSHDTDASCAPSVFRRSRAMKNQSDRAPSAASAASEYYYRRPLGARDLLPAVGAGLGVALVTGLTVFYVTKLFLERTPLLRDERKLGTNPGSGRAT